MNTPTFALSMFLCDSFAHFSVGLAVTRHKKSSPCDGELLFGGVKLNGIRLD